MKDETPLSEMFDANGEIDDAAVVRIFEERLMSFKSKMESLASIENLEYIKSTMILFNGTAIKQAESIKEVKSIIDLLMIFPKLSIQIIDNEIAKRKKEQSGT